MRLLQWRSIQWPWTDPSTEPSYQPLSRVPSNLPSQQSEKAKKLGTFRVVLLVAACCMGSFMAAYDTGIVGGVLTLPSFQEDFGYTEEQKTRVNSTCVSILQAGAFFGCFFIWPITSWIGRRLSLMLCSLIFCIGTVLQVINSHSLSYFYAGRVISGLGVGGATVLIPMFSAEMAPKDIRGKLGSGFQLFFAAGVMISYWVDYLVTISVESDSSAQWRIPVALQFVPGALLGIGMLFVKDSVRWLARKGRHQEAFENLKWVRGGEDSDQLRAEFAEIQAGIEEEIRASEGFTWKELMLPSNRYRMFIAMTVQLCGQLSGNTSLAYYAPQIFEEVGAGTNFMFITGFFGIAKVVGVVMFIHFFVETVGRRKPFIFGAFGQGILMLIIVIIVATNPPSTSSGAGMSSAGIAAIFMVYLEAFVFNMSWGPLPWLYIGEIFPNRIREIGIAAGAASQWFFNFMMSQITPYAIANIGWGTFLVFAVFNFAIVVYSFVFLKETRGFSLEEMDVVFGTIATKMTAEDEPTLDRSNDPDGYPKSP